MLLIAITMTITLIHTRVAYPKQVEETEQMVTINPSLDNANITKSRRGTSLYKVRTSKDKFKGMLNIDKAFSPLVSETKLDRQKQSCKPKVTLPAKKPKQQSRRNGNNFSLKNIILAIIFVVILVAACIFRVKTREKVFELDLDASLTYTERLEMIFIDWCADNKLHIPEEIYKEFDLFKNKYV